METIRKAIRNPVTADEVHPRLVLPEGLLTSELALFCSRTVGVEEASPTTTRERAALGDSSYAGEYYRSQTTRLDETARGARRVSYAGP